MAKKGKKKSPEVHDELKGFNIKINEFGEITSSMEVDKLNEFLNENLEDKKLVDKEKEGEEQEEDGDNK